MALNIKDPETDRLARELAAETGESLTVAMRRALEDRLRAVRRTRPETDNLDEIIRRGRARQVLDNRPESAILGYDDAGMPA